jgi:hypothetical protein
MMLGVTLVTLIAIWLANMLPTRVLLEPVMTAGDGGWEDGSPDETLSVESPEDPSDDPSVADLPSDVTQLMEITDPVTEMSDRAAELVEDTSFTDQSNSGNPGSAEGTGGRPLGSGGPGRGGAKREQRWMVVFADKSDLNSYARQLDFFRIELGLLKAVENRLIYVSSVSTERPLTREVRTADSEKRLFMNWEGGDRKKADADLCRKAGLDPSGGVFLHFYPPELENRLAELELSYAGRTAAQIRRTVFEVKRSGDSYEFVVTDQKLK